MRLLAALLFSGALLAATGCGGDTDVPEVEVSKDLTIPAERLAKSWPIQLSTEESIEQYTQKQGWMSLMWKRNYRTAIQQLGPSGGIEGARIHAEMAALYRQSALLAANAMIETYGETPEASDPVGTKHLLAVSYAVNGQLDKARAASAALGETDDPTQAWHGPWKTWLAGDAAWPPDLSSLPFDLGAPTAGGFPTVEALPHYSLPELGGSTATRDMGDPSALIALALWHDAAAKAAAGDKYPMVEVYRAGYRLPIEADVPPGDPMPMDLLYGSDMLTAGDAPFLADVHSKKGASAIDAHVGTSLVAYIAKMARKDGKIDAERAVDIVTEMRSKLVENASAKTDGNVLKHQRIFADIAYVGTLRNLALVAEVEGDREASGLLRINAMERSEKHTACPVGMMALGAWDASNRYPLRAQDILHAQARRFPSLETARYGLDVLALRVSRERTGETPGL